MKRVGNSVATTEIPSGSDSYHRKEITWPGKERRWTKGPSSSGEQREVTTWRFSVTAWRSP